MTKEKTLNKLYGNKKVINKYYIKNYVILIIYLIIISVLAKFIIENIMVGETINYLYSALFSVLILMFLITFLERFLCFKKNRIFYRVYEVVTDRYIRIIQNNFDKSKKEIIELHKEYSKMDIEEIANKPTNYQFVVEKMIIDSLINGDDDVG